MHISITTGKVRTPGQLAQDEEFLKGFLPKLKQQRGVLAVHHFNRPDEGETVTLIIWKDKESMMAYRQGDLIRETIGFAQKLGIEASREDYPITYSSSDGA